jgi:hypothetical protein
MYSFRPPKRHDSKPVAKVASHQQKSGQQSQSDDTLIPFILFWASTLLAGIVICFVVSAQRVAQVGDVLDFHAGTLSIAGPNIAVTAHMVAGPWAPPSRSCTLAVSVMEKPGGTMSVMAVRPDGVMLSWVGGATASGAADCSSNEPILVANADYGRLQMALAPRRYDPR